MQKNWVINKYFQTLKPNKVFKTLLGLIIYHQNQLTISNSNCPPWFNIASCFLSIYRAERKETKLMRLREFEIKFNDYGWNDWVMAAHMYLDDDNV